MYVVESKGLAGLFAIWQRDVMSGEEEAEPVCVPSVTLSDAVGVAGYIDPDETPVKPSPILIDSIIQHYLNEHAPNDRKLIGCMIEDVSVRFIWFKDD